MKLRLRLRITAAALALMQLLLFAGCGGKAASVPEDNARPDAEQGSKSGSSDLNETGVLKLQWYQQIGIDTLFEDPWQDRQCLYPEMLFDSLLHKDRKTREPIPGLASDWSVSEDLMTITFTLRSDAYWSDGEPVTAEDVYWTFNAECVNPSANYQSSLNRIVGYDEYRRGETDHLSGMSIKGNTVTFELIAPSPIYEQTLGSMKILPAHLLKGVAPVDLDSYAPYWSKPIGCGQYVIDQVSFPDYFTMVRSDTYWGPKAGIKNVQFVSYDAGGSNAVVAGLINGEIDFAYGNAINDITVANNIVSKNHDVTFAVCAGTYTRFFAFNIDQRTDGNNKPDLSNRKVRQAFDLLIDQPTIASFYAGQGTALSTMCNPDLDDYNKDIPPATKDTDSAVRILQEEGYDFSQTIDLAYYYDDSTTRDIIALIVQDFAEAGITVHAELLQGDLGTLIYGDRNFDLLYLAGGSDVNYSCSMYSKLCANTQYTFIGDEARRVALFHDLYMQYESSANVIDRRELGFQLQALDYQNRYLIPAYALNSIIIYNSAHVSIPESVFSGAYIANYSFELWRLVGE